MAEDVERHGCLLMLTDAGEAGTETRGAKTSRRGAAGGRRRTTGLQWFIGQYMKSLGLGPVS